jgi:hypothetical protein
MIGENAKKLLAYFVILIVLAALSAIAWELYISKQYHERPEIFSNGKNNAPDNVTQSAETFVRPSSGAKELSARELAWLLRERIVLDIIADFVNSNANRAEFNSRLGIYNELAEAPKVTESTIKSASSILNGELESIINDAIKEAANAAVPEKIAGDALARGIWEVQTYLKISSIYLKNPTGVMDKDTVYAIKEFESRLGEKNPRGEVTPSLISRLRGVYSQRKLKQASSTIAGL